jgi:hypothetical protein
MQKTYLGSDQIRSACLLDGGYYFGIQSLFMLQNEVVGATCDFCELDY